MENTDSMQNPVMPATPAPAPVQKPQKTLLIVAGLVVVAALAAGGVWAYNRYAEPAEKKIFTAVEKMAEANSFTYAGTIHVFPSESSAYNNYLDLAASQTGGRASKEFDLSFNGAWEGKTKENKKSFFSFLLTSPANKGFALGMEGRTVNGIFYAKLAKETQVSLFDLSTYTDKWIKLDVGGYLEQFGVKIPQRASSSMSTNGETLDDIRDEKEKEMVLNSKALKINKTSSKKIDGQSVRVYNVTVQKENLRKLIMDINAFENQAVSVKDMESFDKGIEDLQDATGDILIGKKDGFLYGLDFNLTSTKGDRGTFTVSFKDFNKPVTVTEPENAMSLEELIAQVFGSFGSLYGTSSFKADLDFDASFKMGAEDMDMQSFVDADKDGLSDSMEKMYKTNPAKADTDGDGFTDYDEVMKGYNPAGTGKMPMDF